MWWSDTYIILVYVQYIVWVTCSTWGCQICCLWLFLPMSYLLYIYSSVIFSSTDSFLRISSDPFRNRESNWERRESYWRKEMVGKGYSREMREEKFVLCVKLSLRRFYVWRYVVITLFYDLKKSYFYTGNVVEIKNNKNCCW